MLQTDLFFNEAKSIFIVILLIFILKGGGEHYYGNYQKWKRD